MEATLLARFCPLIWLDSSESESPYDARLLLTQGTVLDADTGMPVGSLASNLSNSASYIDLPAANSAIQAQGKALDATTAGVPVFGKVDTIHLDGKYLHSLLYVMCFRSTGEDLLCAHFVKVFVDATTKVVVAAVYGIEGDIAHVWVDAADLKFTDRSRERIGVFLGAGDHTPLPAAGKLWRAGVGKATPSADGKGLSWQESPLVVAWPNQLMQYIGRLGPNQLSLNPSQRAWWDGATTQKMTMGARFLPAPA